MAQNRDFKVGSTRSVKGAKEKALRFEGLVLYLPLDGIGTTIGPFLSSSFRIPHHLPTYYFLTTTLTKKKVPTQKSESPRHRLIT